MATPTAASPRGVRSGLCCFWFWKRVRPSGPSFVRLFYSPFFYSGGLRYKHLVIEEGWFILRIHPLPIDSGRSEADRSLPIDLFPRNTLRRSASPPRSFARPSLPSLGGDYSQ